MEIINKIIKGKYGDYKIIEKTNERLYGSALYKIKFLDEFGYEMLSTKTDLLKGTKRNIYYPNVLNTGYVGNVGNFDKKIKNIWIRILRNCYDKKYICYNEKLSVCKRWLCFEYFLEDYIILNHGNTGNKTYFCIDVNAFEYNIDNCFISLYNLNNMAITSTHNLRKTRFYSILNGMIQRCGNKNNWAYEWYGGKGVSVCDEWLFYNDGLYNFYKWAIENGYSDTLTIDRIDVKGNYEPINCRWATTEEQANNKTSNLNIEFNGVTKNLSEWSKTLGIDRHILSKRFKSGNMINFSKPANKIKNFNIGVYCAELDIYFSNKTECAKYFNLSITTIKKYIENGTKLNNFSLIYKTKE